MDQLGPDRREPEPGDTGPPAEPPPPPNLQDSPTAAYPTPVDTDAAVHTETVEPPPVHAYVAEPPNGPRRVGGRLAALVAILGVLAIAGVAAFGYTLNQDLSATRASLSSTEGDLGATKASLEQTTGTLGTTTTTLAAAKAERIDLDGKVADLAAQVAGQTKCVQLQESALDELIRISDLQTVNFNRTTEGSTWAKAEAKRNNAVSDALEAYYQAYSKAFDRNLSSARAWADKGKAAVDIIAVQAKQQVAEFDLIDRSAAEIEAAIDALEQELESTEQTCAEVN